MRPLHLPVFMVCLSALIVFLPCSGLAVEFAGGTGDPNDPYQIATAEQLIGLGEDPNLYDKHFIMTTDIDLDPNLPGRRVFDRAVIAPDWGSPFTGVFDGNGHALSNLTITGGSYLGLFGGMIGHDAEVRNLILVDANIVAEGSYSGILVGRNGASWRPREKHGGRIVNCCVSGAIDGMADIGGLLGHNNYGGYIEGCCARVAVSGVENVGGLIGLHGRARPDGPICQVTDSYAKGTVFGEQNVGGLVGNVGNGADGTRDQLTRCYAVTRVSGNFQIGALSGFSYREWGHHFNCFYDYQVVDVNACGNGYCNGITGLTTEEMQTASTFLEAGWDFVGETANGPNDVWMIVEGQTYPLLAWQKYGGGTGEPNDPYLIYTPGHLNELGAAFNDYDEHFRLMADIDLSDHRYDKAVVAHTSFREIEIPVNLPLSDAMGPVLPFMGYFDGNGHVISNLYIYGNEECMGLFGATWVGSTIRDLSLDRVYVEGNQPTVGSLAGLNAGSILECCSSGLVSGGNTVGGLVGENRGIVTASRSFCTVTGVANVGGLIGLNASPFMLLPHARVSESSSSSTVSGRWYVGGLVGANWNAMSEAHISASYSTCTVIGNDEIGGLVGSNRGYTSSSYSIGRVTGDTNVGGLVGSNWNHVDSCFWDIETSGQSSSAGGQGMTRAQMQTATTFLDAGWDFEGETTNGTHDIWWIDEGLGTPRLWWEN